MIKKKNKVLMFLGAVILIVATLPVGIRANANPMVAVGTVIAESDSVAVPITLSANTGICGATFSILYDSALTLTNVEKGTALPLLTMTKPGKLSANPIKLVWDGMEADHTNGTIAILTFTVPDTAGTYNVSVSYENGDIVDGNLSLVTVATQNGSVTVRGQEPSNIPTISVSKVFAKPAQSVQVPINVSGNTGICGVTFSVQYDSALTLTKIEKGTALPSLTMTKPGDLSARPIKLVWDGMEADYTNGTMAILTFTVPDTVGAYSISVSHETGDIVDGALSPVDIAIKQGQINVTVSKTATIEIDGKDTVLTNDEAADGIIFVAFYHSDGDMLSIKAYAYTRDIISAENVEDAAYAKIFWWDSLLKLRPFCNSETVILN